ncbi:MAG TPA: FIST N-terminal domain-containing protein [Elusimicrobiota bacterium]|nr:FIST N-terminal domain-containing protein [Elusimicrobiota bacterium]
MSIELGIGGSSQADVTAAGHEAAVMAMAGLPSSRPGLVLVFSSIRFADPRLLKAVRKATGYAPLIGCTDAGGITTAGPCRRSVTVVVLAGAQVQFVTTVRPHVSENPVKAGEDIANLLALTGGPKPKAVLMFPETLDVNASDILCGAEKVFGRRVPIVGGGAADDFYFQKTFQYYDDDIVTDSVSAAAIYGDVSIGVGVRHGWLPLGAPRVVTRAEGHVLYELDGRPAVSIYEDYLGAKREELEPLASISMTYPLGSPLPGQRDYLLRDAFRVGRGGSLVCSSSITEGSSIRLMIGGYESALEAAQLAATESLEGMGPAQLKGALIFCSAARQKMLGSEFQGEVDVIRDALGGAGVRMGGFYSYGELGPVRGNHPLRSSNELHSESVTVVAVGAS